MSRLRLRWLVLLLVWPWATASARDLEAARQHYRKGSVAYAGGAFRQAADEYTLAYQASDDPLLLYNIAVALRLSNQRLQSVRAYRLYLSLVPSADNRVECERAIHDLLVPAPSPSPTPHE